jgi:bacterioferritin-associated ferredoxin
MGLLKTNRGGCREFRAQLEDAAASGAKNSAELFGALPAFLRTHAEACGECREAAEAVLTTRAALAAIPSRADLGGPWFAPRVMAAIAARKAELARTVDTWTFLPRLAVRLTWASSVALLLASAWLYQKPHANPPMKTVVMDITGEPVMDNSALASNSNSDDVLANLAEKAQ